MTPLAILAGASAAVVVVHLVVGWRVSTGLHEGALSVGPKPKDLGIRVRSVTDDHIVLEAPTPRQDIAHPGVIGLAWDLGYGQVGEVLGAADGLVTRRWERLVGEPPVCVGPLGECPPLALDSYAYPTGPGDVGLEYEEITYDAPLGPTRAWVVPGGDGRRWAVMCHGWTAERRELVRLLPAFHRQGFTSMVIDYRNDIGAPLDPSGRYRFGLSEWEDLEAAVGLVPDSVGNVVLAGCSTGGALVMRFLEKSSLAGRVDAVVLDAPNIVLADTLRHATDSPVSQQMFRVGLWLAELRWQVGWAAADYVSRAEQILRVPALVFHGTADGTVPLSESQQLAARVPHLVELVETENAGHVMSWNADPDRYEAILEGFLGRIAAPS